MGKLTLIERKPFVRTLISSLVVLIIIHTCLVLIYSDRLFTNRPPILKLFYLDYETNIPSFFNMLLLLIVSSISYLIYVLKKKIKQPSFYWLFICFIFFFLALDETISIHENVNLLIYNKGWRATGFFKFLWVVPYAILAILFLILSIGMLKKLPSNIRNGFIIAGGIYVTGAVGFEMIGGKIIDTYGIQTVSYIVSSSIEEILEMSGLIIFIHFLLKYLEAEMTTINT